MKTVPPFRSSGGLSLRSRIRILSSALEDNLTSSPKQRGQIYATYLVRFVAPSFLFYAQLEKSGYNFHYFQLKFILSLFFVNTNKNHNKHFYCNAYLYQYVLYMLCVYPLSTLKIEKYAHTSHI